jgi:hypothetical protein
MRRGTNLPCHSLPEGPSDLRERTKKGTCPRLHLWGGGSLPSRGPPATTCVWMSEIEKRWDQPYHFWAPPLTIIRIPPLPHSTLPQTAIPECGWVTPNNLPTPTPSRVPPLKHAYTQSKPSPTDSLLVQAHPRSHIYVTMPSSHHLPCHLPLKYWMRVSYVCCFMSLIIG